MGKSFEFQYIKVPTAINAASIKATSSNKILGEKDFIKWIEFLIQFFHKFNKLNKQLKNPFNLRYQRNLRAI